MMLEVELGRLQMIRTTARFVVLTILNVISGHGTMSTKAALRKRHQQEEHTLLDLFQETGSAEVR